MEVSSDEGENAKFTVKHNRGTVKDANCVIFAIGREPNVEGLNLDAAVRIVTCKFIKCCFSSNL